MQSDTNVTTNDAKTEGEAKVPDIRQQLGNFCDDALLTEMQVAALTSLAPRTLRNQRARDRSIFPYVKLPNGSVRYPVSGVRATIKASATAQ